MGVLCFVKNELLKLKQETAAIKSNYGGGYTRAAAKKVTTASPTGKIKLTGNGFKNGEVIVFTALAMEESGSGLVAGRVYFVIEEGEEFGLSQTSGGASETWTGKIATSSEIAKVSELTGGEYKRLKSNYGAPSKGKIEDTEAHALKVPTGTTMNYTSGHTAETGGSLTELAEVEPFIGPGTYTVTNQEIDLQAAQ